MIDLKGSIVALITPYTNEKIDEKAIIKLATRHVQEGTKAILVCGSTGEGPLLTDDEKHTILKLVVKAVEGQIPVIIGCEGSSSAQTVKTINEAQKLGAKAALVISPAYIRPSQETLKEYFTSIHNNTTLPFIIYNHQGRSGVDMEVNTVIQLSQLERCVGIKDCNPNLARATTLSRETAEDFHLLSGDDITTAAYLVQGGGGVISVGANCYPSLYAQQIALWHQRKLDEFLTLTDYLYDLNNALCCDTNPVPIKAAMSYLGYCENTLKSPLHTLARDRQEQLQKVLKAYESQGYKEASL